MTDGMNTRTQLLIGEGGVSRLKNASVILCGCGAVGGYVLEGLVRAGVGKIRVVDGDEFSASNLNRQVLCTTATVGRKKVDVACERARLINPDIDIEGIESFVSKDTVPDILKGNWDVLMDAIDTIGSKTELLKGALERNMKVFSSMGAAMHMDATSIRVDTLKKTSVCPMAARVRKELRDMDTRDMVCVYSVEVPPVKPEERDEFGKSILGSMPTIPAIFGMTLANEAVKYILSKE